MFSPTGWRNRSRADVESLFSAAKTEPIRGGVGDIRTWPLLCGDLTRPAAMIGGVAVKS